MNPNAKSFTFNPGATEWKGGAPLKISRSEILGDQKSAPSRNNAPVSLSSTKAPVSLSSKPVSLSAAPAPVSLSSKPVSLSAAPAPVSLSSKPVSLSAAPAPVSLSSKPASESIPAPAPEDADEDDEAIDETDPLWIATLEEAGGDREKCIKMLENPDELVKYPKIHAIMMAMPNDDDADWETNNASSSSDEPATTPENIVTAETVKEKVIEADTSDDASAVTPQPESAEVVEAKEGDPRPHVNLVFIGHVDAGKSTLSGSILYLMGQVDKRTIERFEKEAKQRNRESWFLAFIMDTSEEERAKGITVEVGRAHFETETNRYTILDAPGHKNYVPNMISGAAQADVGVLVISARKGEFETGFEKGGQTREHALLAKTLGVRQLIVVINKMDDPTVEWAQSRFDECVSKLKPYLKSCGFTIKTEVKFLPISGIQGANILEEVKPEVCPWWKEMYTNGVNNTFIPTLMGTFDALNINGRNAEAPLRIPVLDRYFERGTMVMGKVESGTLLLGDELMLAPTKKMAKVEAIYIQEESVNAARPGENVVFKLNCNVEDIQKGYVACSKSNPCRGALQFKVQLALIDMLEHRPIFSTGYDAVLHAHTTEIEVSCVKLVGVIDSTGKTVRKPFARQGQQCVAVLSTPLSVCLETYEQFPALGRVTLRDEGRTIAIGKIQEIIQTI